MSGKSWGNLLILHSTVPIESDGSLGPLEILLPRLGQDPVLAASVNFHLGVYPQEVWRQLLLGFQTMPEVRDEVQAHLVEVRASARELDLRMNQRITIPEGLRRASHLEDQVLIMLAADHVQLWNPNLWSLSGSRSQSEISTHDVA